MVEAVRTGSGVGCRTDDHIHCVQGTITELPRGQLPEVSAGRTETGAGIDDVGADEVEVDAVQDDLNDDFLDEVGLDPPPEWDGTVVFVDRWW